MMGMESVLTWMLRCVPGWVGLRPWVEIWVSGAPTVPVDPSQAVGPVPADFPHPVHLLDRRTFLRVYGGHLSIGSTAAGTGGGFGPDMTTDARGKSR